MNDDRLRQEQERLQKIIENSWLDVSADLKLAPNIFDDTESDMMRRVLLVMMDPANFFFTCKHIFNIKLLPFQIVILQQLWHHKRPIFIATRGGGKTFLLALYSMLKALLNQDSKVVQIGSGFRQSKLLFDNCETIWNNAPILRSMVGTGKRQGPHHGTDQHTMVIGNSIIMALPVGDGEKIRGIRSNITICDEFKSHNPEIFETVIAGFGAVKGNPVEGVIQAARIKKIKELGMWTNEQQIQLDEDTLGNQVILSGTAYYAHNHFYKYWQKYCQIINSGGDIKKLQEIFRGPVPNSFDYRDFCVIRMPYELIPDGFMDPKTVSLSQATFSTGNYQVEYAAVFARDSDGFFRRTLIDSCVAPITLANNEKVSFSATLRGSPFGKYVFAIDPASERDNFSVVIIEMHPTHRRIVYCWTTTRLSHREKIKAGVVTELDFYAYCARHIRNLMKVFPCEHIALDSQGGGVAIEEALHDTDKIEQGEQLIWRVIDPEKEFWSDGHAGLHILEMVNFSQAVWVSEANHGMRKDFEDKVLIFPEYDSISLGFAAEEDGKLGRLYDTLEDCATEIEELKDELTTIVMTPTGNSNRDRWDTPEIKRADSKKGRMRKDRYSALLMGNMAARKIARTAPQGEYVAVGGFAGSFNKDELADSDMYKTAPEWFRNQFKGQGSTGFAIKRG